MGFFPFLPQTLPLAGGTITGALTVAGLLTTQAGITNSGAAVASSAGMTTSALTGFTSGGNITASIGNISANGPLDITAAGVGLKVAEGSNAKQGITVAMVAGTTTVANTSVTATSRILLTSQATGGTVGGENVSTRTAGTSFTVTSTNAADTSTVAFQIFEPG